MSDTDELPHRISGYQFHIRTKRRPFEVEEAFLDCFNTLAGGIVLEALHDEVAMRQTELGWESRAEGKKDLWLLSSTCGSKA